MTSAARPTFHPARASGSAKITEGGYFVGGQVGKFRSVRDMPGQMTMKLRKPGQTTAEEIAAKDLLRELEEKERAHFQQLLKERARGGALLGVTLPASMRDATPAMLADAAPSQATHLALPSVFVAPPAPAPAATAPVERLVAAFDDADDDVLDSAAVRAVAEAPIDDDDEEDDTAELMRELARIKREREEEKARKEREAAALSEKEAAEGAMRGNPLLTKGLASALGASGVSAASHGGSAAVKRRFGDDTVFSHTCSAEPEARKRFINDVIRSDFHRNFLRKFIQ